MASAVSQGVSKTQKAVLRYLIKPQQITSPEGALKWVCPSIKNAARKYHLKDETLVKWLVEDKEFFTQFLNSVKADIMADLREMVQSVIKNVKSTGNSAHLKTLMTFLDFVEKQPGVSQGSWESMVSE